MYSSLLPQIGFDYIDDAAETPMTLVGAMDCGDHLVVSADSGVAAEPGIMLARPKLAYTKTPPIAWWFSGDEALGFEFRDWMLVAKLDRDWKSVKTQIANKVGALNKAKRDLVVAFGVRYEDIKPEELIDVLVVGIVGGTKQILQINDRGMSRFLLPDHKCQFLGNCSLVARLVYETMKATSSTFEYSDKTLRQIMDLSIVHGRGLLPPVRTLSISAESGVLDTSDAAFRSRFPEMYADDQL